MASQLTIDRIKNVLCVAELGQQTIDYEHIDIMGDGPNGVKQVTLSIGFSQFGGDLGKVIREYIFRSGKYAGELLEFVGKLLDLDLYANSDFLQLLRLAGKEDPIMWNVQEDLFESIYIYPGIAWCNAEGLQQPFSNLIVCDSFLQSGGILTSIRSRFSELTPKAGGDEKAWTSAYLSARDAWLRSNANQLVRTSAYRTSYYLNLLSLGDWSLNLVGNVAMNGIYPLNQLAAAAEVPKVSTPTPTVRVVTLDMIYDKMLAIEKGHNDLLAKLSTMIGNPSKQKV